MFFINFTKQWIKYREVVLCPWCRRKLASKTKLWSRLGSRNGLARVHWSKSKEEKSLMECRLREVCQSGTSIIHFLYSDQLSVAEPVCSYQKGFTGLSDNINYSKRNSWCEHTLLSHWITQVQMDNNPEPDEVSDIVKWKNDGHGESLNGNSVFFKSGSPEGSQTFH